MHNDNNYSSIISSLTHRLSAALRCLLLALPILLAASCSDNPRGAEAMAQAQQVISENPDSALAILRSVSSEADGFPHSQRMAYHLLMADAKNKAYADMSADSIMHEVADYYETWGDSNERMQSLYLLGCVYRDRGDSPAALRYYNDAVYCADTTASDCDYSTLASLYGQMGNLYRKQTSPKHELVVNKQAALASLKAGDTLTALNHSAHVCIAYKTLGQLDSVLIVSDKIIKAYIAHGRPAEAATLTGLIMEVYAERNEFDKLPPLMKIYETESGLFDKSGNIADKFEIYYDVRARYHESRNQLDSAELYYKKMLNTRFYNCIEAAYKGLVSVSLKRKEYAKASDYAVKYCIVKDTFALRRSSSEINRMHSIYRYDAIQRKMAEAEAQNRNFKFAISLLVLVLLAATFAIYLWDRKKKRMHFRMLLNENRKYGQIADKLNQAMQDYEIMNHDHQNYITRKEKEIDNLKKQLACYDQTVLPEEWDYKRNIYENPLVNYLHEMAQKGKQATDAEITELRTFINDVLPIFMKTLDSNSDVLTEKEYTVCILSRLRFIPSEIAVLTDLSTQRITNIRKTVNTKLFNDNSAKTLNKNLISLER